MKTSQSNNPGSYLSGYFKMNIPDLLPDTLPFSFDYEELPFIAVIMMFFLEIMQPIDFRLLYAYSLVKPVYILPFLICGFFIFNKLMIKKYQTKSTKNLLIYIISSLPIVFIIFFITTFVIS